MFNYNNFLDNYFFLTFYYGKLLARRDMNHILALWLVHSITTEFQAWRPAADVSSLPYAFLLQGIMLSNLKVSFLVFFCKTYLLAFGLVLSSYVNSVPFCLPVPQLNISCASLCCLYIVLCQDARVTGTSGRLPYSYIHCSLVIGPSSEMPTLIP